MLPAVARIFVSSTWIDLQPERHAVEEAINRMSAGKFIGMEYFGSRPETTEGASIDEVDKSDLYVGVFGGRYGSGITEKEYRRARERNLPCFIYFKDDATIPAEWRDSDPRLETLKQDLRSHHIITEPFTSPEILANRVTADLHRWFFDNYLSPQLSKNASGNIITGGEDRRIRLETGSEYGAVIRQGSAAEIRRRPAPVRPSLRPFRGLLDRVDETSTAIASFESLAPVEFCGQAGIGKTSLLRRLAYQSPEGKFPDGTIYLGQVGRQPSADLMQFIFDSFYESDPALKLREAEVLSLLRDIRALILMDDVEIGRDELEGVMNATPDCAILLATEDRRLFGEARVLNLQGLPPDEALQLLERELGRSLSPEEQAPAKLICSLLKGHPLRLAQTAALSQVQNLTLTRIAEQLQSIEDRSGDPGQALIRYSMITLSIDEKRVLAAIASFGGAMISSQSLAEITGIKSIKTAIETLLSRNLTETHESGYRLPSSVLRTVENEWDLTLWRERALNYLESRLEALRQDPQRRREHSAAIMFLLDWATRNGRKSEAIKFGKASEFVLIFGGQWEAWGQSLRQILQSARDLGDVETEAWSLHQQGTREFCLGNSDAARSLLTEALERRVQMGDHIAASVTRHNLDWLLPIAAPSNVINIQTTSSRPQSRKNPAHIFSIGLKIAGVALLTVLFAWFFRPIAKAEFTPGTLSFTSQEVGASSGPAIATLINRRANPMPINAVDIVGAAASDFKIVGNNCLNRSLAQGEKCDISVVFTPETPGERQAILRISSDASEKAPELPLTGSGLPPAPAPVVTPTLSGGPTESPSVSPSTGPTPEPHLGLSQSNLDFGEQLVSSNGARILKLTNTGAAALMISDIMIAGANGGEFIADSNTCLNRSLAPKSACEINITFRPQSAGNKMASIELSSNSSDAQRVNLTGRGILPPPQAPTIQPRSVDFGSLELRKQANRSVTITNEGLAPLQINRVNLEGNQTSDFVITTNDCEMKVLSQNGKCAVRVAFSPQLRGRRIIMLIINDNSTAGRQVMQISGVGVEPAIPSASISPASLDFGEQPVRDRGTELFVTVSSVGASPLQIYGVRIMGARGFNIATNDCSNVALERRSGCRIGVRFVPESAAYYNAALEISANTANSPYRVPLAGRGIRRATRPIIDVDPGRLNFDQAQAGTQGQLLSVFIKNRGEQALRITGIEITGANAGDFRADNRCSNTEIQRDNACEVKVQFRPQGMRNTRATSRTATLLINHNAGSQIGVQLNGATGAPAPRLEYELMPNDLDFGTQSVRTESRPQQITLRNSGEAPFTIKRVSAGVGLAGAIGSIFGGDARIRNRGNFKITSSECNPQNRLNPGASCRIFCTYTPQSAGRHSGIIQILIENITANVTLRGEGVEQERRGWCCYGQGQIAPATESDCNLKRGRLYPSEREARANCTVIK